MSYVTHFFNTLCYARERPKLKVEKKILKNDDSD